MQREEAVIIDAVRSPLARRFGDLSGWHPVDLLGAVLQGLQARTGIDPALIDDVIVGCVSQVGGQSTNVARNGVLAAGWPDSVPGTTIDRQCGSSQQAAHFAAQGVMAGSYDVVVAAGVESMSGVPMFSNAGGDPLSAYGPMMSQRYAAATSFGHNGLVPQGVAAELVADRWSLTRIELDSFALRSNVLAAAARDGGRFAEEIVPLQRKSLDRNTGAIDVGNELVGEDSGIRDTSLEALAALKPVFRDDGVITAGNSSQIADGASAMLIMSATRARQLGLTPLARFAGFSVVGSDPITMLTGPISATERLLGRAGLGVGDIDLFEVNEAFAPVVLAWERELSVDPELVNVNGGAIALGHPLGASGTRVMATLLHELVRRKGRYGVQAICEGGGMANATLIECI